MIPGIPFYEHDYYRHDLRRGTVFNRSGTKLCMMPSEFMLALKQVLEEETGDAWRGILEHVGKIWGKRVARRFQREMTDFYGRPLHEMPTREFVAILEGYFRYHGWGKLTIDLSSSEDGFILARLDNSAFVEIVGPSSQPADSIVAGLLSQFFAQIAERADIDCLETECASMGAPACRFVIGTQARLDRARQMVVAGSSHDDIVAVLCPERGRRVSDSDTEQLRK